MTITVFNIEFIKYIKNGDSIIYISLSSNLSGTFNSANIAKNNLIEEYPDAKIYLVDSLSVSVGQGFLVEKACDMRNNGLNAEEIVNWLEENKRKVVHSILIDDLNHLKRGGRISSTTATIGGLLNIKPTLYIDDDGKLVQGEKIKGKKKALRFLVNEVKERAINTENETLYICHGDCLEEAETLKNMILEEVKFKNIVIITLEEYGSFTKIGNEYKLIPSMKVNTVDSSGAGDIFHGALLYFMLMNYSLEDSIKLSNICGALATTRLGNKDFNFPLTKILKYGGVNDII